MIASLCLFKLDIFVRQHIMMIAPSDSPSKLPISHAEKAKFEVCQACSFFSADCLRPQVGGVLPVVDGPKYIASGRLHVSPQLPRLSRSLFSLSFLATSLICCPIRSRCLPATGAVPDIQLRAARGKCRIQRGWLNIASLWFPAYVVCCF
jgi:hypothetical protein